VNAGRYEGATAEKAVPSRALPPSIRRRPICGPPRAFAHGAVLAGRQHDGSKLKPAPNNYPQRWAVSKRVNSSKAEKDDATLIELVQQAA
jgi:hypothetical protein